jgi:hypothetical protein
VSEDTKGIRGRVDDFFTNYLRNTTTDQEILDFYGEGNVIGRKGIPETDKELLDVVEASRGLASSPLRPGTDRPNPSVGGIDQSIGYKYTTADMPGVADPETKRPWQMTFGSLPKDFGAGSLTPAAQQFLVDFRVPKNAGSDYSFATGPNIQDRIDFETKDLIENNPYVRQPERLQEKLNEIQNKSSYIGDYSGQPMTPRTWQDLGYVNEKPANFKEEVLKNFKDKIFKTQGAFGGVSTLTPVEQRAANNPRWRADLYQTEGLAGPLSNQGFSSGYGGGSKDVQRFTTGSERLLPLQPYSEFFQRLDATPASALATKPAEDFTPFQKAVGTRNYLIGQNILAGRGSLGAPVRAVQQLPTTVKTSVKPATKAFLLDAGINYALGASPQEALFTAISDPISAENLGGAPTAPIERLGPSGEFVDTRSNTVLSPQGRYTNTGIAYKGGKPVIVPRGSVAGEGNIVTQTRAVANQAQRAWQERSRKAGNALQYFFGQLQRGRLPYFNR